MMGRLPSMSGGATSWRIRRQLLRALPPPLNDDHVPPPPACPSPMTSSPATVKRYIPRDPISRLMLFNLTSVRAMFTLVLVFMLLNHTSIRTMFILVSEIIMIYILVLI